jgi:predicted Holliday junction resolvase-like endonuclease
MILYLLIITIICGIVLFVGNRRLRRDLKVQIELNTKILSQKKSSEVRLGQISEHLAPFLLNFKHDPKKAHFLGMPIDYIVFEEDNIIFLEIKSGEAHLSKTQQQIKKLVEDKKVVWEVMRIN